MAINILMPALSPTMTEGTLARWLKKEGDQIAAGDVVAEIETDKATMEVEAVDEGVLGRILVPDGTQNVAVNAPIAIVVEKGEAVPDKVVAAPPGPAATVPAATAEPATVAVPKTNGHAAADRIFASPLARRIAADRGMDLAAIKGTGPNGRILRADVEQPLAKPAPTTPAEAKPAPAAKPAAPALTTAGITAPHRLVPHSTTRRVIARRLTEAKQTVPHFYVSTDIDLDALLKLRAELNARAKAGAFKLSVNDMLIKAAALALRAVPEANASYTEDGIVLYDDVDISVAVSIPDGLITPIIRRADSKKLVDISNEMKDLGARAKAGKLKPEEFQGGGFSLSNLGMFGVTQFAAIINPPQGGILAIGAGEQRPVVRHGAIAIATVMTCTLSCDHRAIDGALGARWLQAFKATVEDPLELLL